MSTKILVVDIETSGFLSQGGKIVEIGIVELDLLNGVIIPKFDSLIKEPGFDRRHSRSPFGWVFENSDLTFEAVNSAPSLESVRDAVQNLFDNYKATAFNKSFDFDFLRDRGFRIKDLPCPMQLATPICKVPFPSGCSRYKWPKVEEAWRHFFGNTGYIEKHRGLDDAMHEAKIVFELYKMGAFPLN